jgi:hypothetical protein
MRSSSVARTDRWYARWLMIAATESWMTETGQG